MVPSRIMLENMGQKQNESLRQYAQRWRDVAAQIQPPIPEHEITPLFINTLNGALYDLLIDHTTQCCTDLIRTGESLELAIKSGRIESGDHSRRYNKKNEVNTTSTYNAPKNLTVSQSQVSSGKTQSQKKDRAPRKEREKQTFTLIPVSYSELYSQLHKADLVRPYYVTPFKPPFLTWYDPNAHCEYHDGAPGHPTENCLAFKKLVQNLINTGVLKFEGPNVAANTLPNQGNNGVNAIEEFSVRKVKEDV